MKLLTPEQGRHAARLERDGLTLRGIATAMGVSFEAVCLGLYGSSLAETARPTAPMRMPVVAEPWPATSLPDGASLAVGTRPEPVPRAEPVATKPAPALFRLGNELGEWLDRSGVGMTRDVAKAWQGNAAQLDAVLQRKPHYRDLKTERVT